VIRGGLASTTFGLEAAPFVLLGVWCVGGVAVAFMALNRSG
jgi:hypothetical protein